MNEQEFWQLVKEELKGEGLETQTKSGLWFRAITYGNRISIARATKHAPVCRLNGTRTITEKDFVKLLSLYPRWIKEEPGLSREVLAASQNSAYVFALIKHFIS